MSNDKNIVLGCIRCSESEIAKVKHNSLCIDDYDPNRPSSEAQLDGTADVSNGIAQVKTESERYTVDKTQPVYHIPALIAKKRDGLELTKEEIQFFVNAVVHSDMQDVQIGSLLMAIFLRGMHAQETADLTKSMLESGISFKWPRTYHPYVVDKHSTGGVGDKISLILAPALAACGAKVPMISGRGLGHTGGTLDKMQSIPGYHIDISFEEASQILEEVGCFIIGQTADIVPADKKLYACRDICSTIESIPLITASILSKKAAEDLSAFLLDLKCGKAAFMKNERNARELGNSIIKTGERLGIKTKVIITRMDYPLGKMIGNSLEVQESIQCLAGLGPKDLEDLTVIQGGILLHATELAGSIEEGKRMMHESLHNGTALKKFEKMLIAQGVDPQTASKLCDKNGRGNYGLPRSNYIHDIVYHGPPGVVTDIDALVLGLTCCQMGAGRQKTDDIINYGAGLELIVHVNGVIESGQPWIRIHHDFDKIPPFIVERVASALTVAFTAEAIPALPNGHSNGHANESTNGSLFDGNHVVELMG